jgi:hypothetical protein
MRITATMAPFEQAQSAFLLPVNHLRARKFRPNLEISRILCTVRQLPHDILNRFVHSDWRHRLAIRVDTAAIIER